MVSVDISLSPPLPGATLTLSGSRNKRILGDFMGFCFFGRLRLRQKEGVTRIPESKNVAPVVRGRTARSPTEVTCVWYVPEVTSVFDF